MNNRVEQLKHQAWMTAHMEIGNPAYENAIANRAEDILIELIIKECSDIMAAAGDHEAAAEIELHFGIE